MSAGSRCTAGQRVKATNRPNTPPISRNTMPATAFSFISVSAGLWNSRPVSGQVRNSALFAMGRCSLLHVDFADHLVMTDAAVFVADHREFARFIRRDLQHHFITRNYLHVDVLRLQ